MSIRFKNKVECIKKSKEEIKAHIIENLINTRYGSYQNTELRNAMREGTFKSIYDEIISRVFS